MSKAVEETPDATYASRRPPDVLPKREINLKSHYSCCAARGDLFCVGSQHHLRAFDLASGEKRLEIAVSHSEARITAMAFGLSVAPLDDARYVWVGTKEGHLFEVDLQEGTTTESRTTAHAGPIVGIYKCGDCMITVDEQGKTQSWPSSDRTPPQLTFQPRTNRLSDQPSFVELLGDDIWTASSTKSGARWPVVRTYTPTANAPFVAKHNPITLTEGTSSVGSVISGAIVPRDPDFVYLGHDSGHISVWNKTTVTCNNIIRPSVYGITALQGVGKHLWAGHRNGVICVYDVGCTPWKVLKSWQAHKDAVSTLVINPTAVFAVSSGLQDLRS